MNARSVPGRAIGETKLGTGLQGISEPRRWRGTRILDQARALGMLECALRFAVVIEAEFIDGAVADGPGMADIPLLEAFAGDRSETRNVGASGLELGKW